MKRSRFTEEQIIAALKQHAAGASTKEHRLAVRRTRDSLKGLSRWLC